MCPIGKKIEGIQGGRDASVTKYVRKYFVVTVLAISTKVLR